MNFTSATDFLDLAHQRLHRGRADNRIFHQQHAFPFENFGQRRVFLTNLFGAICSLDKRAADIAIANQTFQRGHVEIVGHGVGGRFGRVGYRDDNRVTIDCDGFAVGQLFAEPFPREINAAVIQRAGDVGEIDPLEKAVGAALFRLDKLLHRKLTVFDDDCLAGLQTLNTRRLKTHVRQRNAFAGGGKQRPLFGVAQRPNSQRVAGNKHISQRVQEDNVVCAIESFAQIRKDFKQFDTRILCDLPAQQVHNDFGVGLAGEMKVVLRKDFVSQLGIVRQLPVEGETKPLCLLDVMPFERLGVAPIIASAGGITDVSNGCCPRAAPHQRAELPPVIQVEDFGHRADIAMRSH